MRPAFKGIIASAIVIIVGALVAYFTGFETDLVVLVSSTVVIFWIALVLFCVPPPKNKDSKPH